MRAASLHEGDFYAWTRDQAQALRRLAELRPNEAIDFPHLIEEVEDLGKSQRVAVRSQAARLIEHLLRLEYSPAAEPRGGWLDTAIDARRELRYRLSPSLRRDLGARLARLYEDARQDAARRLRLHGEIAAAEGLPATCPYRLTQLLDEDWYPLSRHGPADPS
jgi:hypothetical protein